MTAVLAPTPRGPAREATPAERALPSRPPVRGLLHRAARCMAVSVTTTVLSLAILVAFTLNDSLGAGWANAVAWAAGTVASYRLNRRWVWAERTGDDALRQVVPFWLLSLGGLLVSTVAVRAADAWTASAGFEGPGRSAVLAVANVAAYASLWIAQFVLLDRVLFKDR